MPTENIQDKKIIKDEDMIRTPENLMAIFIAESMGIYIKQKNNEHIGAATNEEVRKDIVEDLGNLLNGMEDQLDGERKAELQKLIGDLRKDLPKYIEKMDEKLTVARNDYLIENKMVESDGTVKDSLILDNALAQSAKNSDFTKVKESFLKMLEEKQHVSWEGACRLFKENGCKDVSELCADYLIPEKLSREVSKDRRVKLENKFRTQLEDKALVAMIDAQTPQEFVGAFIEQSAHFFYDAKKDIQKSPDEIKTEMKSFFNENLLGAMSHQPNFNKEEAKEIVSVLRENMDSYVDALAASKDNRFVNAGRLMQDKSLKRVEDTGWAKVAELCEKIGLPDKLIDYFDKKNEESKEKSVKKSIKNITKKLGSKDLISDKEGAAKSTPTKPRKGKDKDISI